MISNVPSNQQPKSGQGRGRASVPGNPPVPAPCTSSRCCGLGLLLPVRSLAHSGHSVGTVERQGQLWVVCTPLSRRLAVGPRGDGAQLGSSWPSQAGRQVQGRRGQERPENGKRVVLQDYKDKTSLLSPTLLGPFHPPTPPIIVLEGTNHSPLCPH